MAGEDRTEHTDERTFFDQFAGSTADIVSRAPLFTFCVLLVVVWAPTYFLVGNFDTYQLIINTPTTIITFLLVALLQNTQHKLNAIADDSPTSWTTSPETRPNGRPRRTWRGTWGSKRGCR